MAKSNLATIILFIAFLTINSDESRILNFYHKDGKIYSIEGNGDNFNVLTKELIFCVKEPCIYPVIAENAITDKEDIQTLKSLFADLFVNFEIKEINSLKNELTDQQKEIVVKVLKNNKIISSIEYEIVKNPKHSYGFIKKRGYLYKIEDGSVLFIISMGRRRTSGYSIEVKKVEIKGDNVTIFVTEKRAKKSDYVAFGITYPTVEIRFNKLPSNVLVLNYYTGEIYPHLK